MKSLTIATLAVWALLTLTVASCGSAAKDYDPEAIHTVLQKQSDWTADEYQTMYDQLQATDHHLTEKADQLSDTLRSELLQHNIDLNYYLMEALNAGTLPATVADEYKKYLGINK